MTPHNKAERGMIAKKVLMPGDPLRAKFIAENFLSDAKEFNSIRSMFGYTGTYKGTELSVMGSGMGIPSIGIYSYELYKEYDVESIIRVGSCGSYREDIKLFDIIMAMGASSDSNFAHQFGLDGTLSAICDYDLLSRAVDTAKELNKSFYVGNVFSSDIFYNAKSDEWKRWRDMGVLAVEMECYGLYLTANSLNRRALGILSVSDSFYGSEIVSPEERQKGFTDMIEIALETCLK